MQSFKYRGAACLVLAFAPISLFVTAAEAASTKKKKHNPPPPAAVSSWQPEVAVTSAVPAIWTGIYAGLSGGYGLGRSEQHYDRNDNHGLASTSPSGGLAAVTLGYNWRLDNGFIVGAEGDLGIMDVSADDKIDYDGHTYKTSFGPWWGTIRARGGVVFGDNLIYATGGLAFMGVDEISVGNTPGETAVNKDTRSGWVVGAGIEHVFAPGMTAKLEYLHMDFGSYSGFSANNEDFSFNNRVDMVRVGINYGF
ncbi:MAG: outer membrane beta-barrel protein [Hyphomicrobium sp.]